MDRAFLLENGWRRHSIISNSSGGLDKLKEVLPSEFEKIFSEDGCIAIISTYDCAVVSSSFEAEPWLQLQLAFPKDKKPQYEKCRDPRVLHFSVFFDDELVNYETNATCLCQIDRQFLLKATPCQNLVIEDNSKEDLKTWLAERFRQGAWPDAFNDSLKPAKGRLKSLWKRYNDFFTGLYIQLDTYEEKTEGKYIASIIVCVEDEKFRALIKKVKSTNKQLNEASSDEIILLIENEVLTAFGNAIELTEDPTKSHQKAIEIMEEGEVTLHQMRTFSRFSPYNLSMQDDESIVPFELVPGRAQ